MRLFLVGIAVHRQPGDVYSTLLKSIDDLACFVAKAALRRARAGTSRLPAQLISCACAEAISLNRAACPGDYVIAAFYSCM